MTQIKMRPRPDPERLPLQSAFMARFVQLRRDGYGCEDIAFILRRENMPTPIDHVRTGMGFKAKALYLRRGKS